jgi:hypothetical protein
MSAPQPIKTIPNGALSFRPHGMFFSTAMTEPNASIQPTFPMPTPNINSINAQQQPTQKIP